MNVLRCVWLLVTLLVAAPAQAEVLVLDRGSERVALAAHVAHLVDAGRDLDIQQVRDAAVAARFRSSPEGRDLNLGITPAALWVRLELDVRPDGAGPWLLEVGYPPLDRIEVFHGDRLAVGGDLLPSSARPFAHRFHVIPLDLASGRQTVYLRITTQSSLTAPLTLWRSAALHANDQWQYSLYSGYLGALIALVLYNFLLYLSLHDRVYITYVAYAAAMTTGQVALNGLGGQFLWPEWVAWGNVAAILGIASAGFFGVIFTRQFLHTRQTMIRMDRVLLGGQLLFSLAIALAVLGRYDLALATTSLVGIAFAVAAVICGTLAIRQGNSGARFFLLAWTMLLGGGAITALRNMGWLPTNMWTLNSLQVGSTLELLLLSFALADRIHVERRGREQAQAEALAATQANVALLERSEAELEQRVADRTAALEAANQRLEASEQRQRDLAQHDALTGLANRALFDDRLGQAMAMAQRDRSRFALLYLDLDKFKPVNDSYGHGVGDLLLKQVAQRIAGCVRESDTVARIGGDEFVIILRAVSLADSAAQVAENIRQAIEKLFFVDGHELSISCSIGVAIYPDDATSGLELAQCADSAMYRAKEAGRNAVVLSNPV